MIGACPQFPLNRSSDTGDIAVKRKPECTDCTARCDWIRESVLLLSPDLSTNCYRGFADIPIYFFKLIKIRR